MKPCMESITVFRKIINQMGKELINKLMINTSARFSPLNLKIRLRRFVGVYRDLNLSRLVDQVTKTKPLGVELDHFAVWV